MIGLSAICLAAGCEHNDALGEARFRLCRGEQSTSCDDQSTQMQNAPALFSSSWSSFEKHGVVAMVNYPLSKKTWDDDTATGFLWIDLDLQGVSTTGETLASDQWNAEYIEQTSSKVMFEGSIQSGRIEVTGYDLSDVDPVSVAFQFDLSFSDPERKLRLFGDLYTHGFVEDYPEIQYEVGSAASPSYDLDTYRSACDDCYDCQNCYPDYSHVVFYHESTGCSGDDEYDDDSSGCTASGQQTGSGCEGDTYEDSDSSCEGDDGDYDSSDSSCEGDDGDHDSSDSSCEGDDDNHDSSNSSCEGDEYTEQSTFRLDYRAGGICPTRSLKPSRSALSRQLNLLLPAFSVWILCFFRRRSLQRTFRYERQRSENGDKSRAWR